MLSKFIISEFLSNKSTYCDQKYHGVTIGHRPFGQTNWMEEQN